MIRFRTIILLMMMWTANAASSSLQNAVSGQIIDDTTQEPVVYVNVFLANTTLGTTTDSLGYYSIANIPPGNYSLVVSHISHNTEVRHLQILSTGKQMHNFALTPAVLEMQSVQIERTRDEQWREQFETFKAEFLGYSEHAQACEFVNPEVLHVVQQGPPSYYATTLRPLEMKHHNFGYRVTLIVRSFISTNNRISYSVLPAFEEMTASTESQAEQWLENRLQAFYGSYRHFFLSLFSRQLEAAGFSLERVDEAKRFRASIASYTSQSAQDDIYSNTAISIVKRLHFPDYLRVRYQKNWAQTSFLNLPFDTMQVDVSGNTLANADVLRSGHWGRIRFADELPLDYLPE